jgi:hypothetical protein
MWGRSSSWLRIGVATGLGPLALWCVSCSLITSLDGLSNGADGDASVAAGTEGGAGDGNAGTATDGSAREGGASASAYRAAVLADSPLAYWRLGEAVGSTIARDETGHGHDGTVNANVVFGSAGAIAGDLDSAARFDGLTTAISIGDVFRFDGVSSFTLEAWARPSPAKYGAILARNLDPNGYALFVMPSLAASFERQKNANDDVLSGPILPTSSFTYLVATYDGSQMRLYANGALVKGPMPSAGIDGSSAGFFIGVDFNGDDDFFKGDIDEPAVYDHALTDTQIRAHYLVGRGP